MKKRKHQSKMEEIDVFLFGFRSSQIISKIISSIFLWPSIGCCHIHWASYSMKIIITIKLILNQANEPDPAARH